MIASRKTVAFTGAGISVESGIPLFRGKNGLLTKYGSPKTDSYHQFLRDPDTWYKSTERTIYKVPSIVPPWFKRIIPPMEQFIKMNELLIWHGLFKNKFSDRKFAIRIFNEHIKNVRRHIPKEDLLIFNVKDGWRPLCDFLGVPIPKNIPFPHVNTGDNMIKTLNIVKLIPYLTIILVTITLLYYLYLLNK